MKQIIALGDSLVYGAWDSDGGWLARLRKNCDEKVISSGLNDIMVVYCLGIPGETTEGLLERFENEIDQRVSPGEENIILIGIGINDSEWILNKSESVVNKQDFRNNILRLSSLGKQYGRVFFIGLTPVDQSKTDPIPWMPDRAYKNDLIKEYDEIISRVCHQSESAFIDLLGKLSGEYKANLIDGAHPNSEGHMEIYEIVKQSLCG